MTKILVIEDDKLIRETLLEILESRNFEAVGAANGQVGIEIAFAQVPDLILSDVMMPLLNGFEVFRALRSNSATASIPFIFMTGTEMEKALKLKADGYLNKPYSYTQLLAAIAAQLQKPTVSNPKYQKIPIDSAKPNPSLHVKNQQSRWEIPSLCSQSHMSQIDA